MNSKENVFVKRFVICVPYFMKPLKMPAKYGSEEGIKISFALTCASVHWVR